MPYIATYTGRKFKYDSDTPDVSIIDIAHHLALVNRFSGASRFPYSVAQHSCLVTRLVARAGGDVTTQLQALVHDAHEAYMSDIPTPYQAWVASMQPEDWVEVIEHSKYLLDERIYAALNIPPPNHEQRKMIKEADQTAFVIEASQVFVTKPDWISDWAKMRGVNMQTIGEIVSELHWRDAKAEFTAAYGDLRAKYLAGTTQGEFACSA